MSKLARASPRAAGRHSGERVSTPYVNTIPRRPRSRGSPATRTSSAASAPTSAGTPRSWSSRRTSTPTASAATSSTFASSAALYEVGFNHFFRGKDDGLPGDQVYIQGHAAPGHLRPGVPRGPARRGASSTTSAARSAAAGLSSLPAPAADARLLGVPDGVDGPRPDQLDLPGPLQPLPAEPPASTTPAARGCGASSATARCDEPETLGSISLAGREQLDNLIFVVNCNLQRLDGPVRGNGKIIQELEAVFRGAGWNVIKVIWGSKWDELLARDVDGVLLNKMNTHRRRRVPEVRRRVGRVHPRALLRSRPAPAQDGRAPLRRRAAQRCPAAVTTTASSTPPTRPRPSRRARPPSSWPRRSRAGRSAPTSRLATPPTRSRR